MKEGVKMRIGAPSSSGNFFTQTEPLGGKNDSIIENIQRQILNLQEQLKSISQDKKLSAKEKAEKQKQLQEEITLLKQQLTERQLEIQKESREKQSNRRQKNIPNSTSTQSVNPGLISSDQLQSLLLAGNATSQIKTANSIQSKMKGESGVLKGEIKQDQLRGVDVTRKSKQLAHIQAKIENLESYIAEQSSDVNHAMTKDATEADASGPKTESDKKNKEKKDHLSGDTPVSSGEFLNILI
jgi:hypothetical protein